MLSCLGLEGLVQQINGSLKDFGEEERHDKVDLAEFILYHHGFFILSV